MTKQESERYYSSGSSIKKFRKDIMTLQYSVIHYTENGRDIFDDWLKTLKDKNGIVSILRVIKRAENGNFGEHRFCRDGVWELVINTGPGYRVYYSMSEKTIILLLCAGSKRTQQKDIDKAVEFLKKYKEEHS